MKLIWILSLIILTTGCASISSEGRHQAVLVRTSPPGATVFRDNRSVGQTPKYVSIERGAKMAVDVASSRGPVHVPLRTHYRWKQSFFPNLILFTFAPIGWLVDLATGAAWQADSPPPLPVRLADADSEALKTRKPADVVAVAPPLSDQLNLSETGGHAIETQLMRQHQNVIPYDNSLPTFLGNDYDYDGAPPQDQRAGLYYSLGATRVWESTIVPQDDHYILQARERDVYSGNLHSAFQVRLEPESKIDRVFSSNVWWSRLLPNTLAVDFVDTRIQLDRDGKSYDLTNANDQTWLGQTIKYLGALNITSLPPRRYGRSARWTFNLVPLLRASRRQVTAEGLPVMTPGQSNEEEYTRWLLAGGYGGELGWQVSRHYLYLNVGPVVYWSNISWKSEGQDHVISNTGVKPAVEIGYILYFSQNWNARFFSRNQSEDADGWNEALSTRLPAATGNTPQTTSASQVMSGISVGYRFEPGSRARLQ